MAWQKREKMPRYDRTWDRKELIRRSLTIAPQSRDDFFGGQLLVIAG